jgi:hypothetical protein
LDTNLQNAKDALNTLPGGATAEDIANILAKQAAQDADDTAKTLADAAGIAAKTANEVAASLAGEAAKTAAIGSATTLANGLIASFDAIAQPIADQITQFADDLIDGVANLVEEVKDITDGVINSDTVQCFVTNASTLETQGATLKTQTESLFAYQTTIQAIANLATNLATSLTSLQGIQSLDDLEGKVAELKTLINDAKINLEEVKTIKQELETIKDTLASLPCLDQLSSPAIKALEKTINALDTMITPLDILLSPNARLSDYLYALADATQAIAEFIEATQTAAKKLGNSMDTINEALAKLPNPLTLPTLQNPLAPLIQQIENLDTVQKALEDISALTKAAGAFVEEIENWIEDTAIPAISALVTDIKNIDRKALENQLVTDINKLLVGLEIELKKLPSAFQQFVADHKDEVIGRITTNLQTVISQLPTEEQIKQTLENVKEAIEVTLAQAKQDTITYLNENALDVPTFTNCSSGSITTTGNNISLSVIGNEKAEEVRGYLAVVKNVSGEQQLYVLPSTGGADFALVTIATGEYTVEVRTIGKDSFLHTSPVYDFFLALDLDRTREEVINTVNAELAKLQTAETDEWNKLPSQIKTFLTFLGNTIITALPDEARNLLKQGLSDIQSALSSLDKEITALQMLLNQGQNAYGKRNLIEETLATSIITLLEKADTDTDLLGAIVNDKNVCTIERVVQSETPSTGGNSGGSSGGSYYGGGG